MIYFQSLSNRNMGRTPQQTLQDLEPFRRVPVDMKKRAINDAYFNADYNGLSPAQVQNWVQRECSSTRFTV